MAPNKEVKKETPEIEFGMLEQKDIVPLMKVAEQWVRDPDTKEVIVEEMADIRDRLERGVTKNGYMYLVVREKEGENYVAIGMCGLREPEERMKIYRYKALAPRTLEMVNVFLDKDHTRKGLGKKLMTYCFAQARKSGALQVIWNSGRRYKDTAWEFYTRLVGVPVIAKDFYKSGDAMVWSKDLSKD